MILLDTHIWHWWVNQVPGKLSPNTIALIEESAEVCVSSISCFEMAWLVRHGRIDLGMDFDDWLKRVDDAQLIRFLPVVPWICACAVALPEHHKDPQDRLIIATALYYRSHLISFDTSFPLYQELSGSLIAKNL